MPDFQGYKQQLYTHMHTYIHTQLVVQSFVPKKENEIKLEHENHVVKVYEQKSTKKVCVQTDEKKHTRKFAFDFTWKTVRCDM